MSHQHLDQVAVAPDPAPSPSSDGGAAGLALRLAIVAAMGVLAAWLLLGTNLPGPSLRPSPSPTPDAFAELRAESQAALERGQQHLQKRELELALIELDRARVTDPDNRADIQALLNATLEELRQAEPTKASLAPTPQEPRPTPTPYTVVLPRVAAASPSAPAVTPSARPRFQSYRDAENRFSVDFPPGWETVERPPAEAGVGVVGFRSPDGAASLVVSLDVLRQAVSPELYAAHLETQMETLPGYQLETASPWVVNGAPALKRQFFVQRAGEGGGQRTIQVVVGRRAWMFILTGTAPASSFDQAGILFDQIIRSFRITA